MERGTADGQENELLNVFGAVGGTNKNINNLSWKPNSELLIQLINMGIDNYVAKDALFCTNNNSIESAINFIFESKLLDENKVLEKKIRKLDLKSKKEFNKYDYKMVFVVNYSLNMGIGKTSAQVAHATLGLFRLLLQRGNEYENELIKWSDNGETKIVLKADSAKCLIELKENAVSKGLVTYLVHDAGKTQISSGSITVLSIFGNIDSVNLVTKNLRLL